MSGGVEEGEGVERCLEGDGDWVGAFGWVGGGSDFIVFLMDHVFFSLILLFFSWMFLTRTFFVCVILIMFSHLIVFSRMPPPTTETILRPHPSAPD